MGKVQIFILNLCFFEMLPIQCKFYNVDKVILFIFYVVKLEW